MPPSGPQARFAEHCDRGLLRLVLLPPSEQALEPGLCPAIQADGLHVPWAAP